MQLANPLEHEDLADVRAALDSQANKSSIGFVVDSACDLPPAFLDRYNVHILPINLRLGGELFEDVRDEETTQKFYETYKANRSVSASSIPYRPEEIESLIMSKLMSQYEYVIFMTISSSRSKIYQNTVAAKTRLEPLLLKTSNQRYKKLNGISVHDTRSMFTGQAVVAYEAIKVSTEDDSTIESIQNTIKEVSSRTHGYLVPNDLFYMRHRASKRGDESVGKLAFWLAEKLDIIPVIHAHDGATAPVFKARKFEQALKRLLDNTREEIQKGLYTNFVAISYAGDLNEIKEHPEIKSFIKFAREHDVKTKVAMMSVTACLNVGPGAFSLAYAA